MKNESNIEKLLAESLLKMDQQTAHLASIDGRLLHMESHQAQMEDHQAHIKGHLSRIDENMLGIARILTDQHHGLKQVSETQNRQEGQLEMILAKLDRMIDFDKRLILLENAVFKKGA